MTVNRPNCHGFFLTAALVLLGAAALAVDMPIAQTIRAWRDSPTACGWLDSFNMFEMFGYLPGVIVLLVVVHQLDPGRRWAIPRVAACSLIAGGLADVLKMLIIRTRPYEPCPAVTVWDTFGQWLPILCGGSPGQSFPSAHTATAVGLAAALTWLYPQGRNLFIALAVLVGCQRIACGAHYLSDVLVGAAAGCVVAMLLLKVGRLPELFDRWEGRWGRDKADTAL
jgi:membrane-associated phospholipid phosphatase